MHERIEQAFSLTGRVAVLTGAASGIGRESAIMLAQAGAKVVLADVDEGGLAETVATIGPAATAVRTDVSDRAAVDALAARALDLSGRIDIWANIAGVIRTRSIIEAAEADLDHVIGVNLKGVYWGCAAAARAMKAGGGGSIINMSSAGAESAVPNQSIYSMTKAAVNALTRTLAKEMGPHGVRANSIAPGFVETPLAFHGFLTKDGDIDPALREEGLRQRRSASVLGLTGEPSDIAFALLYLASDASRFVTGQILRPNGGVAMP